MDHTVFMLQLHHSCFAPSGNFGILRRGWPDNLLARTNN